MSARQARVTSAMATVKMLNPATGKWAVYGLPQGALFPAEADPENVANLVRRGYAEWVDADPEPEPAPAQEPAAAEEAPAPKVAPVKTAGKSA